MGTDSEDLLFGGEVMVWRYEGDTDGERAANSDGIDWRTMSIDVMQDE